MSASRVWLSIYLLGCFFVGCVLILARRRKAAEEGADFKPRPVAMIILGTVTAALWPAFAVLMLFAVAADNFGLLDPRREP